jgi:hypothetical protein
VFWARFDRSFILVAFQSQRSDAPWLSTLAWQAGLVCGNVQAFIAGAAGVAPFRWVWAVTSAFYPSDDPWQMTIL